MSASPPVSKHFWKWWHPVLLLAIIVAIVVIEERWLKSQPIPGQSSASVSQTQGTAASGGQSQETADTTADCNVEDRASPHETVHIKGVWIAIMVLLAFFILVAGHGITGYWRGALIDSRNKISLSRFQMTAWTVLIMSAYLTAVLINIHRGQPNATDICLDETLWALMGITTTSLVGSPLLKGRKKGARPFESPPTGELPDRTQEVLSQQGVDPNAVKVEGSIIVNQSPNDASWMDLFRGETVEDAGHLDLGKIQMFFFTIITLLAYAVVIGAMFDSKKTGIVEFPVLSDGMVALLGISHAGYLASKAASGPPSQ